MAAGRPTLNGCISCNEACNTSLHCVQLRCPSMLEVSAAAAANVYGYGDTSAETRQTVPTLLERG